MVESENFVDNDDYLRVTTEYDEDELTFIIEYINSLKKNAAKAYNSHSHDDFKCLNKESLKELLIIMNRIFQG